MTGWTLPRYSSSSTAREAEEEKVREEAEVRLLEDEVVVRESRLLEELVKVLPVAFGPRSLA